MVYLVTALQCEAAPLIHRLGLELVSQPGKWRLFGNDDVRLIVCGTGSRRAAMGTVCLLADQSQALLADAWVVNVGICGATSTDHFKLGDLLLIDSIRDHESGQLDHLKLTFDCELPLVALETFDRPVTITTLPKRPWPAVDMEAAGFYEAACRFVASERVLIFKVVSDYLEGRRLSPRRVSELVEARLDQIFGLVDVAK